MSVRMPAMRGAIVMKTSLLGSTSGILAFIYALAMSREMMCLLSAAASWAMMSIAKGLAVREEVSIRLYPGRRLPQLGVLCLELVLTPPVSVDLCRVLLRDVRLRSIDSLSPRLSQGCVFPSLEYFFASNHVASHTLEGLWHDLTLFPPLARSCPSMPFSHRLATGPSNSSPDFPTHAPKPSSFT